MEGSSRSTFRMVREPKFLSYSDVSMVLSVLLVLVELDVFVEFDVSIGSDVLSTMDVSMEFELLSA